MSHTSNPVSKAADITLRSAGVLTGSALAAVGGWLLYSSLAIDHDADLPFSVDAAQTDFSTQRAGRLSYYSDTRLRDTSTDKISDKTPLVLLHSINAAGSALEMEPLFERFRGERPVYAPELPGFGFSNRMKKDYTPELFTEAILEFLRTQVGEAAYVVALSLTSEFVARAALEAPALFKSLTFISPTGLNAEREAKASAKAGQQGGNDTFYSIASQRLWARAFYDLIATRASIHYFLKGSFVGEVPGRLERYSYRTAHQPGAQHAPLYFISGKLFTPQVRERMYEHLGVPTLVIFDEDGFISFEKLPALLHANPNVKAVRLTPSRGLPQFEAPERTAEVLRTFWQDPRGASQVSTQASGIHL